MGDRRTESSTDREARAAQARLEAAVRLSLDRGDAARAARDALAAYGAELFGFVVGVVDDRGTAGLVYADASARLERELGTFRWTCALRTWMYSVVRQELGRHRSTTGPRPPMTPWTFELPAPLRTLSRRPTTRRSSVAALRRRLHPEDRELLVLRLGRSLDWNDVAITSLGCGASRLELAREAGRLRARMQAVREELARSARSLAPDFAGDPA